MFCTVFSIVRHKILAISRGPCDTQAIADSGSLIETAIASSSKQSSIISEFDLRLFYKECQKGLLYVT